MREILFRGKRFYNGKWVYGIPVETEAENGVKEFIISRAQWESDDNSIDFLETDVYEIDPDTIGAFTGLTDKNGVKIFEGDVLESQDTKKIGLVAWIDRGAGFVCRYNTDFYDTNGLIGYRVKRAKIIGNIHDNPELLEEKI